MIAADANILIYAEGAEWLPELDAAAAAERAIQAPGVSADEWGLRGDVS